MLLDFAKTKLIAAQTRAKLVQLSHQSGAPHLGSSLSCVDILAAVYWHCLRIDPSRPHDPDRDRFILSKGHAAPALYTVLAQRGFFPEALLDTFGDDGGQLPEQPSPQCVPGVEAATGSLGHGLGIALGMALAGRIHDRSFRVIVLMSDGELNEGSVWEAAMFAAARKTGTLTAIIDYNKWQATDRSQEVMALEPLAEKWRAFGWRTFEVDGHDLRALVELLNRPADSAGQPTAILAHTIKGKGVSYMEDDNNWHYRIPTAEEVLSARRELLGDC
jgi:transketolase